MNTRKVVLAATLGAVAILTLSSIGFAAAQTGGPGGSDMHDAMGGSSQMSGHADMDCDSMAGMEGAGQMHEAVATALGLTVAELDAQLASGKTVADIASEKGIDLETLHATMQDTHGAGHGTGMDHAGMMSGGMMADDD
jgi:hypothetical protein